jgi:hypothetical protein
VGPTRHPVRWLPGLKRRGCIARLSSPSNVHVNNGLNHTSVTHIYFYGVYRTLLTIRLSSPFQSRMILFRLVGGLGVEDKQNDLCEVSILLHVGVLIIHS